MQYTITLADGRQITELTKNGDNYVSYSRIDESIFKNNLSEMTISDGETTETFKDMVFIQQMEWPDGKFYLAFREKSENEKIIERISTDAESVTDLQLALAEIYEMMIGGIQ